MDGLILRQNKKNFFGYLKEEKLFYVWVGDRLFFLPISLFRFLSLCRQNNTIKERHKNCVAFRSWILGLSKIFFLSFFYLWFVPICLPILVCSLYQPILFWSVNFIFEEVNVYENLNDTLTSLSSSSKVNSFFLTTLSWLRKLNSAAFFCNLANLFSYLDTFFKVGLTLCGEREERLLESLTSPSGENCHLQFATEVVDLGIEVGDLNIEW